MKLHGTSVALLGFEIPTKAGFAAVIGIDCLEC